MDLRVYVAVTSCDPLRVFVYKDGLARFATVKYTEPTNGNVVSVQIMHGLRRSSANYCPEVLAVFNKPHTLYIKLFINDSTFYKTTLLDIFFLHQINADQLAD